LTPVQASKLAIVAVMSSQAASTGAAKKSPQLADRIVVFRAGFNR
jgi:hypothetical protein